MLLDLLLSATIVMALLGAVFSIVSPFDGVVAVQSQSSDLQQRQRAVLGELHREILMAGSGPYPNIGTRLAHLRPPVTPAFRGLRTSGPTGDRLSVLYAATDETVRLMEPLAGRQAQVSVAPASGCPSLPCGLSATGGRLALVFDAEGRSDLYRIVRVRGGLVELERGGDAMSPVYPVGARMVAVSLRTYYFDAVRAQLRLYDGVASDLPLIDGVDGFSVQYSGDGGAALPVPRRLGSAPVAPCLVADGADLPRRASVVQPLALDMFTDGPWCGPFDADLFRIRRVHIELALRPTDGVWNRPNTTVFTRARATGRQIRIARLDVAPRSIIGW